MWYNKKNPAVCDFYAQHIENKSYGIHFRNKVNLVTDWVVEVEDSLQNQCYVYWENVSVSTLGCVTFSKAFI